MQTANKKWVGEILNEDYVYEIECLLKEALEKLQESRELGLYWQAEAERLMGLEEGEVTE